MWWSDTVRPPAGTYGERMRIRLRQIVMVARDLDAAEQRVADELGVELCYRDPGVATFGLRNALFPIGDKLLEIVSPTQDGTTAGRFLDKRGGDGGYMVIFETDDLDDARRRFDDAGARVVFEAEEPGVVGLHLHPADVGGAIVSIDRTDTWGEWPWAGPEWRDHVRTDRVTDVLEVHIEATDPRAMAARWSEVLGRGVDGDRITLDEGAVVFVPAGERGEGVAGFVFAAAPGADTIDTVIAGCRLTSR
jgi:hypothetical protein